MPLYASLSLSPSLLMIELIGGQICFEQYTAKSFSLVGFLGLALVALTSLVSQVTAKLCELASTMLTTSMQASPVDDEVTDLESGNDILRAHESTRQESELK